jgi:hypothetical protein
MCVWLEESVFRKAEGEWYFEEILRPGEISCLLSRARLALAMYFTEHRTILIFLREDRNKG